MKNGFFFYGDGGGRQRGGGLRKKKKGRWLKRGVKEVYRIQEQEWEKIVNVKEKQEKGDKKGQ